ncbi:hypothetical protein [Aestuariicoccus sp. MJ-SS9]|uniref:hypothetical protein n=1 Tax=Aestuariicoccus sp. MJ-SS9 TaxID=3079855 RepID=UPI0029121320|nr:hypothetical protein [Aestuariicoccus sp. MJ-SS9]MDU8912933.1 hypothetical protein [Aestuariicoccus sp. MJ-SS9]
MNKILTAALAAAFALSAHTATAGSLAEGTGDAVVEDDDSAFIPVGSLGGAGGMAVIAGVAGLALIAGASDGDDSDETDGTPGT